MRQAAAVDTWTLDERDGELLVRTDTEGPAARLGHRLTIAMTRWRAEVTEGDAGPTAVRLEVDVSSLQVRRGEGGLRRQSALERAMTRRRALRTLEASRHPTISYAADSVTRVRGGYDLDGELAIRGVRRPLRVHVSTDDGVDDRADDGVDDRTDTRAYRVQARVVQTDFGVQPVAFFAGALLVSDEVTIELTASRR